MPRSLAGVSGERDEVMPGERPGITNYCGLCTTREWVQLRRSASQMPPQAPLPPLQEPLPVLPTRRPVPVALLSPALTLTISEPSLPTLPLMLTCALPALTTVPLVMRIGYR